MDLRTPSNFGTLADEAMRAIRFFEWHNPKVRPQNLPSYRRDIYLLWNLIRKENENIIDFKGNSIPSFTYKNFLRRYTFSRTTAQRLREIIEIQPPSVSQSIAIKYITTANSIQGLAKAISHFSAATSILTDNHFQKRFSKIHPDDPGHSTEILNPTEAALLHFMYCERALGFHKQEQIYFRSKNVDELIRERVRSIARKAANARHADNREIAHRIKQWFLDNRLNFKSLDEAAETAAQLEKVAFRTARKHIGYANKSLKDRRGHD